MNARDLISQAKAVFTAKQVAVLERAVDFATAAHKGQKRASGEPFIVHPLSVASLLIDWGMDIDTVVAGVLHDTVEDSDTKLATVECEFGKDVAFLVDGVTKVGQLRAGMRNIDSYLPKTKDNLTKFLIAIGQDVRVLIVKLADRLHNLQTLQHLPPDKQQKIARESLEIFAPLADRLNMGRLRVQMEEISFSYLEPARYKMLARELKRRLGRSSRRLDTAREQVKAKLDQSGLDYEMDGRIKSVYSLHKKLAKTDQDLDAIYDLIALRIIVPDVAACYQVLGLIHTLYKPVRNRIKDYISVPKLNGYQSLHTTVLTPDDQVVEFQIRTREMHDYAERGLAASFHYNAQKLTSAYSKGRIAHLPANLQWITDLQEVAARMSEGDLADIEKLKVNLFSDQVFIYSPKGDIYDLPAGATPLDFAYRIHSDIAKHASGFKVNGKMVGFNYCLQSGDTVEVLTRRSSRPNLGWLKFTKTAHARERIRRDLNQKRV